MWGFFFGAPGRAHLLGGELQGLVAHCGQAKALQRSLHPDVQHMLLVQGGAQARWFASHPPLAERIRRIYGRPMAALPLRRDDEVATRPAALF